MAKKHIFLLGIGILILLTGCTNMMPVEVREKGLVFYDPLESKETMRGNVSGGYFAPAIRGNGFYSNGGGEGIIYENNNIIDYVNSDGTIEFYVMFLPAIDLRWYEKTLFMTKPELFYNPQMHSEGLDVNYISIFKDAISFELNAGGLVVNISNWKADEWHHIALTWKQDGDRTNARLYLDGSLVSSEDLDKHFYLGVGSIPVRNNNLVGDVFVLGSGISSDGTLRSYSHSAFDELKIYNYAKDDSGAALNQNK